MSIAEMRISDSFRSWNEPVLLTVRYELGDVPITQSCIEMRSSETSNYCGCPSDTCRCPHPISDLQYREMRGDIRRPQAPASKRRSVRESESPNWPSVRSACRARY